MRGVSVFLWVERLAPSAWHLHQCIVSKTEVSSFFRLGSFKELLFLLELADKNFQLFVFPESLKELSLSIKARSQFFLSSAASLILKSYHPIPIWIGIPLTFCLFIHYQRRLNSAYHSCSRSRPERVLTLLRSWGKRLGLIFCMRQEGPISPW